MTNAKIRRTYINPKYATMEACQKDAYAQFDFLWSVCQKYFRPTFKPNKCGLSVVKFLDNLHS